MTLIIVAMACIAALAGVRSRDASPMQDLNSTEQLRQRFRQDSDKVRLVALVSPICPACRRGFADMQSVLKDISDTRLRIYIVWLPMFPSDSRSWAQTKSDEFRDDRVSYYWDGGRIAGGEWRNVLGIDRTAWDVYMMYGSGIDWDKQTPAPSFWMHQLGGITKAPQLNKAEFETKVKELLAAAK